MLTTEEILDKLRGYKMAKAGVYGIEAIGLFGSSARGEHQENSDIDVCVKLKKPSFLKMSGIQDDLENIFSRKVDVISLGAIMRPLFKQNLERDAVFV